MFKLSQFKDLSLTTKLVAMMIFLSFTMISILMILYTQTEKRLSEELEKQARELTKAIQVGVQEVTATGETDEARLSKYLKEQNAKGLKEISIISNADEIVASTNPEKIGQPITRKRKDLIIKAELGEPVADEGKSYDVIVPVIAGDTQYGYIHLRVNKEDISYAMKLNAIKRIIATLFVFSLGIGIALVLSKKYTQPIKYLVQAANRVAAGDLNQRIPVTSKDELGQLSDSFNKMVHGLSGMRSLEERLREAEHLSGIGQLSRSMAHEIRNPLNFINLSIDYLKGKYRPQDSDAEQFDSLIDGIKLEIQRLNKLVNDYLDYSRPLKLNLCSVKVNPLLEDLISLVWAKADAEGIQIIKQLKSDPVLRVDADLLKSCVLNIIVNAVHAMEGKEGPRVLILNTNVSENEFVLAINDTGSGVKPENIEKIFEPFFSTKKNGLGLGLSMTKRVIEEHGGRIEFSSIYGEGSEFRIILPFDPKRAEAGPQEDGCLS
ncbi:MAG: HAMP domain-containing histidine kinase [Nitrospiraceae bacterium]|nr:HAMP domain-containing histidine kinase [Nitrospiraceae bacterium]